MVAWATYANALIAKGHGHPLWEPDPGEYAPVELTDVGYICDGAFVKLFNASKGVEDPSNCFGLPMGHVGLEVGAILRKTPLPKTPEYISSEGVLELGVELSVAAGPLIQSGIGFSFECASQHGGLLIMGDVAFRQDALDKRRYYDYIVRHHRSWIAFANSLGRGISLSDLILVTGCDKISDWACAAWSEKSKSAKLSFTANSSNIVEGSASIWGRWESPKSCDRNVGPQRLVPHAASTHRASTSRSTTQSDITPIDNDLQTNDSTSSQGHPTSAGFNQCVFVRGFRIGDRSSWFNRRRAVVNLGDGLMTVRKPFDSKFLSSKYLTRQNSEESSSQSQGGLKKSSISELADYGTENVQMELQSIEEEEWLSFSSAEDDIDEIATPEDAIINYLLQNSEAELALVHDDDVYELLQTRPVAQDFHTWIGLLSPQVFVDGDVCMLQQTYFSARLTSREANSSVTGPLPPEEFDFHEVLDEEILRTKSATANRAPLMAAWAFVVAERLGYRRKEALSIASVYSSINASAMGGMIRLLHAMILRRTEAARDKSHVNLLGIRPIRIHSSIQALHNGVPVGPGRAFFYIKHSFRAETPHIIGALRLLAASRAPEELNQVGWDMYVKFRPDVKTWAEKGEVRCGDILALREVVFEVPVRDDGGQGSGEVTTEDTGVGRTEQ